MGTLENPDEGEKRIPSWKAFTSPVVNPFLIKIQ